MKIYEAETLTAATKSRAKQYEDLKKEVAALKKEFQGIVGLDNEFQGAGATAIKSFYEAQIEVADAWMELFTTQISFLEGIPGSLEEADLSGNTVVEVPFLDGEVSNGINQAKSLVDEQANDLQRILNSIDDILPLDLFDQKDFNEKITLAGHRLDDTVTKVDNIDRQLVEEYDVSVGQENVAVGLFRALLDATKQDGNVSPMTFDQSAFKSSDVYQVKDEVAGQMKDYQTFKKQQAEARKIEQEMEELENRPWYEKAWDTTKTFTGEFTGYYDSIRASTGVDPVTGRKLSDAERIAAGAMAAAGFIPVVGWAGRAIKGGSALYKTAKGLNAADHALDAYKTTKGFSLLQKTEYGIYGLLAANGLGEAATGKDMFGNQLTEEQRQNGLLMALGIGGVAGAAKVADKVANGTKFVPYSKEFAQKQVQKVQAFGRVIGKVEVPLRIRVEELATAYGNNYKHVTFDKTTIKDIVQKFAAKSDGGKGMGVLYHVQRISEIEVKFKQNPKHNAEEFARQLKDQEKGLNGLTIDEYLKNRERYIEEGRALEGNAAQKAARVKAYLDKVDELRETGLSRKESEKQATVWINEQAALHNPDQIAGGNPLDIGGMGDKRVNSSLGSQWRYRIDVIDEQIKTIAASMTEVDKKSIYLNVKLIQ
ncbi:transposase [Bacillus sp. AFS043905]|uniref:polymorphic toxin type 15 domain-containing protein n=1 Tax=Peribacillus frigoritolerans TaxID=450367 RepID=UPI000BFCFF5D|nr:T7SS effector LXG polymorphic toxin [Peribacillus frigoritolerans]PHD74044.1 transposase [Bacillus sp. AFS043905]TWD98121.1 putative ribonuclease toxin of YeeF-YezG toxin-antitoxin module [Peribacillus frigoritolerans]